MRRVVFALLATLLALSVSSTVAAFETPEAAVRGYLEGVSNADVEQVLGTSAIDEMTAGYRFEQMVDRLRSYQPSIPGPVHSPFFAGMERASWTWQLLRQARTLAYSLLAMETLGESIEFLPLTDVGSVWATGLIAELDEARLDGIAIAHIRLPEPELYGSAVNLENGARLASIYGADELTDRVALLTFEGDTYAVGFQLLRYDDDWLVLRQDSPISGLSSLGTATPMSAALYDELTSE